MKCFALLRVPDEQSVAPFIVETFSIISSDQLPVSDPEEQVAFLPGCHPEGSTAAHRRMSYWLARSDPEVEVALEIGRPVWWQRS